MPYLKRFELTVPDPNRLQQSGAASEPNYNFHVRTFGDYNFPWFPRLVTNFQLTYQRYPDLQLP